MKKLISIFSILTLGTNSILMSNFNIYSNFKIKMKNDKRRNFKQSSYYSNINWGLFNKSIGHEGLNPNNWDLCQIINNNFNIDYSEIKSEERTWDVKRRALLFTVAKYIDKKYKNQESKIFEQTNVFKLIICNWNYRNNFFLTILASNNSSELLNDNSDDFTDFTVPNNNISSFYLRISNNSSMNWTQNTSYFDITLNICNFGSSDIISSESNSTLWERLNSGSSWTTDTFNTFHGFWWAGYGGRSIHTTPTIDISYTDICPQFINLEIMDYFLDYSELKINPAINIYTYGHGQSIKDANPQNYFFNIDNLEANWSSEDPHFQDSHSFSSKKRSDSASLPTTSNKFDYSYFKFWFGSLYSAAFTHIWQNVDDYYSNCFNFNIYDISTLSGYAMKHWNMEMKIMSSELLFYINQNVFLNNPTT